MTLFYSISPLPYNIFSLNYKLSIYTRVFLPKCIFRYSLAARRDSQAQCSEELLSASAHSNQSHDDGHDNRVPKHNLDKHHAV